MSERKVIKLPEQEPVVPDMGDEPSMADLPPMGNDDQGMMPMNDMGQSDNVGGNPFDTNFDAGVEANEEEDPKKYIQQLTGKLSQSLRSYNENLPQPDADLNKYVAGMILKQSVEGLSPEDTNEILDKVNGDEEEEMQQPPQDDMMQQGMEQPDMGNDMPTESRRYGGKKNIDEIFNQVMQDKDEDEEMNEPIKNTSYRKKPFTSPNFK